MAESGNGGTTPTQPRQSKELSTELRLLIAFVLMGVVMFVTPYFYKSAAPPPPAKKDASAAAQAPATVSTPAQAKPEAAVAAAPVAPVSAEREDLYFLDTDLFHVTFSNRGGVVTSWLLKRHKANTGKPLELVNTAAKVERPFSLYFKDRKPAVDVNQALFQARPDPDGLGITYEFSDGKVLAKKTFRFDRNSYLLKISSQVSESGSLVPAWLEWRGGFGDQGIANPSGVEQTLYYDADRGKLVQQGAKVAKDGPASARGNYTFAGLEDTYFTIAFLPQGSAPVDLITFSDVARTVADPATDQHFAGAGINGGAANQFSVYVGPKDLDTLKAVNPRLEALVDFGWFSFLAKPLFLVVKWVTGNYIHNYGWAIIAITVVLNFLLFPLKISSMKSMKKMQALQPQIAAINDKFKGIGIRDPRKAEQNQEVMELYKKHGVNPMGGCMPMVLQIPFFIAFYQVFTKSVEMRGASWLWVTDLSQPEHLAIKILPLAMIASQFIMQKMTPNTSADPNQQRMMLFMPLVFGFMFYNFSSGLVLYYLTSNLVGIAQQWFFNRTSVAEALARSIQASAPRKKNGRK